MKTKCIRQYFFHGQKVGFTNMLTGPCAILLSLYIMFAVWNSINFHWHNYVHVQLSMILVLYIYPEICS